MRSFNRQTLVRFVYSIAFALLAGAAIFFVLDISIVRAALRPDRPAVARSARSVRGPQLAATTALTLDVPILMYHHIGSRLNSPYNISTKDFAAQMDYLAQHGYTTVSIDQVAAALRGQTTLPLCPVALTFDDGYAVQYNNALPILQQHNFHATFYLPTGYISMSYAFMNWDQIKDLMKQGNWIGSHTYWHAFIGRLSGFALKHEIVDAKTKLESGLGLSVTTFAYPFGSYSFTAQHLISDTGFTSAVWLGASYHQSSDRIYKLNRLAIYSGSLTSFISHLPKHGPSGSGVCPAN